MAAQASPFGDFDPKPTVRYFYAVIPLPDALAQIQLRQAEMQRRYGFEGKLIRPDRLHMTLCRLGDYAGENPDVVGRAVQAAVALKAAPFEITLDRVGSFAGRAHNRPLVLFGGAGVAPMEAFQRDLGAEMTRAGLAQWAKPSTPHATLLYDDEQVDEAPVAPVSWKVDEFVLVRSLLRRTEHIRLGSWKLG